MQHFSDWVDMAGRIVWGPVLLGLLLGVGLLLTVRLRLVQLTHFFYGVRNMCAGLTSSKKEHGDISPFEALSTALAATVGTGNIVGVATAIHMGGPGAVFWMWCTALVGMATKYTEAILAVHFRERDERGRYVGGPMYYIKNGLGKRWAWLGWLFALFGMIAAFGVGDSIQANSVADVLQDTFQIPEWITGLVLAALVAVVLMGGIRRIGKLASMLVPFMSFIYFFGAGLILIVHAHQLVPALVFIVHSAFHPTAAVGGFAGSAVVLTIRYGVARGVLSNESGLGTAAIAHAAAKTENPKRQASIAMLGTFVDTLLICSMTALVILVTGAWKGNANGAVLSLAAFHAGLGDAGSYVVTFGLVIFAFTTLLGWSYYGERCAEFLFGVRIIRPYRVLWVLVAFFGAMMQLNMLWGIADVFNGLMALPNLIGLLMLSAVAVRLSRQG